MSCLAILLPAARVAAGAALAAGILFAGAPASAAVHVTGATLAAPGSFPVGTATLTLVDPSRPTLPSGPAPGSPVRTLPTDVYYPAVGGQPGEVTPGAPIDDARGPYALLVFAHGLFGARTNWAATLAHLASHGYVVAAPDFPRTNFSTLGTGSVDLVDLLNQPGDVSFEIDTFTGAGDPAGAALAAVVDGERIGLFGHSYGGATSFLTVFGGPLVDPRLDAVATGAPLTCPLGPDAFSLSGPPLLILHGTSDAIVDAAWSRIAYRLMAAPKFLAEIVGGDHLGFITDPTLPPGLRDQDVLGIFTAALGDVAALFNVLGPALEAVVPGADFARCLARPPLPDPGTPRDPLISVDEQVRITNVALTAFFDAFVRGDRQAERFLVRRFPRFDRTGRTVRFCKGTTERPLRRCRLPLLPSSPSGGFLD